MAVRQRTIDEDQKLALLERMEAGESVSKLAKEAGISPNGFTIGEII